jgi:zinc protease
LLCYRSLGGWVAKTSTRTSETIRSVELSLEQMKHLRNHSISDDELGVAKSYLVGHQALEFETSEGIAGQVLDLMLYDLPLEYWNRLPERIQALGIPDVWETARRYSDPDGSVIVLVGNAAEFRKDLKKFGAFRVIPLANLDFASDNLERPSSTAGRQ